MCEDLLQLEEKFSYNKDSLTTRTVYTQLAALSPLAGLRGWVPTLRQGPSWTGLEEAVLNDH